LSRFFNPPKIIRPAPIPGFFLAYHAANVAALAAALLAIAGSMFLASNIPPADSVKSLAIRPNDSLNLFLYEGEFSILPVFTEGMSVILLGLLGTENSVLPPGVILLAVLYLISPGTFPSSVTS
jgi:hypothetical protein